MANEVQDGGGNLLDVGDVVRLDGAPSPKMLVDALDSDTLMVTCIWFDGGQLQRAAIAAVNLRLEDS